MDPYNSLLKALKHYNPNCSSPTYTLLDEDTVHSLCKQFVSIKDELEKEKHARANAEEQVKVLETKIKTLERNKFNIKQAQNTRALAMRDMLKHLAQTLNNSRPVQQVVQASVMAPSKKQRTNNDEYVDITDGKTWEEKDAELRARAVILDDENEDDDKHGDKHDDDKHDEDKDDRLSVQELWDL